MEKWEEALEQQERDMELEEARKRAENGYDRLLDEFQMFLDEHNPTGLQNGVSAVNLFTAIYDEFFNPGLYSERYTTAGLDFLVGGQAVGAKRVIGSYRGLSFWINTKSATLHWCDVGTARKALGFMVDL